MLNSYYPGASAEPGLTIYLAGKVRGPKHEIAQENTGAGITFICSDGNTHAAHLWGIGWSFDDCANGLREEVTRTALSQLREADMLFAYLDTPDSYGSIAEITYFIALGKPALVTILTGGKADYDRMFDAYWFVCSLPGVRARQVDNLAAASAILDEFLNGFAWGRRRAAPEPTPEDIARGLIDAEEGWRTIHAGQR
jgi:nucleoside 2-deoxyribosyltransferase